MRISRGNTISQIGKTVWRYCYAISSSIPLSIYVTTYKGHHHIMTPIQPYLLHLVEN